MVLVFAVPHGPCYNLLAVLSKPDAKNRNNSLRPVPKGAPAPAHLEAAG